MIAIAFGILMGITHFFSDHFREEFKKYNNQILSFSAGIALTYIFLNLFPEFTKGVIQINEYIFISVLAGFVIFHIIEKYIYQHSPEDKQLRELAIEDSVISFTYHFIIGIVLVSFFNQGITQGMLFFIPAFLFTTVSTLPVDMTKSTVIRTILAASTLLGILFALFIYTPNPTIYYSLLGFIIGALSFTVTRHSIPKGKQGKPLFFIIGVIIYSLLIFLL